jgi:membrane protein DedA with SNARE-associated domain
MAEVMEQVRLWIEQIILLLGYPGIALVMLVENIFPPIPSELVMPFAGFLTVDGRLNLPLAIVAGTSGSVLGAVVLYYIGRWADEPIVRRFLRRYGRWIMVSEADLDRVLGTFDRYGQPIVFFGRLIPIIRSLISVPAGMHRMPVGRFLLFTLLGSLIWTSLLTYAGVLLGENWPRILDFTKQYERLTLFIVLAAVVIFLAIRLYRNQRDSRTERSSIP